MSGLVSIGKMPGRFPLNQDQSYEEKASDHAVSDEERVSCSGNLISHKEDPIGSCSSLVSTSPIRYFSVQDRSSENSVAKTLSSSTETTIDSFSWKSLGLNIKWLEDCLAHLNVSVHGFGDLSDSEKGKHLIKEFLSSDMRLSCGGGDGMLPKDIDGQHDITLRGAFLLQVDAIEDITNDPDDDPDDKPVGVPPGFNRVHLLSMTDGVQCVSGLEDRPIKDLQGFAPFGFKVVVDNVKVREGFLVLEPGHLKVLGGEVKHLEAERQKSQTYLGMQWFKATPTPNVWKPNGPGGYFMEGDSTSDDGFSSSSDIQDPAVEEEALSEPKEVEEDAAVPENGLQKEMAGVMGAGNTFRAKASLEQLNAIIKAAGTTCAAADTTCETVLHQIEKIWDEVGECQLVRKSKLDELRQECLDVCRKKVDETVESDAQLEQLQHTSSQSDAMHGECHGILLQIQQECFNVYQRKFDQEKKSRDYLVKEMDLEKEELTRLASVLGVQYDLPKSAVMEKQFSDIFREVERLQLLKDVMEEKFAYVQSQIQEILEELPEEAKVSVPTVEAKDLSRKSLGALETQLLELQSSRVKFHNNNKYLEMAEPVVCDIRKQKREGIKKEKEITHIETDPEAAQRKITSLFNNSEEMLVQVKNWMSACELYSWLEDYDREENSYSSSKRIKTVV